MNEKVLIKTIENAMCVLDVMSEFPNGVSIGVLSEKLAINTNMTFRILQTMKNSGYVDQDVESSKYSISLKVLQLSRSALSSNGLRDRAAPYMDSLWKEIPKANINLAILYQNNVIVINRIDNEFTPKTFFTPGKIVPIHATALGKMLICELEDDVIDMLLHENELKKYTDNTKLSLIEIKEELKEVRKNQVAWDNCEHIPNDTCIAAPIRDTTGNIIAAISLSAFANIMSREELEVSVTKLLITAKSISRTLGYDN